MYKDVLAVAALGLLVAACGDTGEQRAATGGLTGIGAGALIGGPVGAVVGGAVGAAGGAAAPEGADTAAEHALHKAKGGTASSQLVREAQTELQHEGLYDGPIDGIAGAKTKQAIAAYQQREGLQQTARLDHATLQRMDLAGDRPVTAGSSQPKTDSMGAPPASSDTTPPPDSAPSR